MLHANQARQAYAGTLPVDKFIPEALRTQIEQNIRMALMMRLQGATIELDNVSVADGVKRWLDEYGYNTKLIGAPGSSLVSLHVSWSTIVIP